MPEMAVNSSIGDRVAAVRRFSRTYTRAIGVLRDGLHNSSFSLTEARVLYELATRSNVSATDLAQELELDPGYLSRIMRRFADKGLVRRETTSDRRRRALELTETGRQAFVPLDVAAREEIGSLLGRLPDSAQTELVASMGRIERLLSGHGTSQCRLRRPQPGDIGWVVARHGALYASEYGFDSRFEALVAQVAGEFLLKHDDKRERCWIAEQDGVNVGSVFLVRHDETVGKLRLLLVEPSARGLGIGKQLVEACIGFARSAGYRRVTLWTNDVLVVARGIYKAAGFRLVRSQPHNDFGPSIVGEDWELTLSS